MGKKTVPSKVTLRMTQPDGKPVIVTLAVGDTFDLNLNFHAYNNRGEVTVKQSALVEVTEIQ